MNLINITKFSLKHIQINRNNSFQIRRFVNGTNKIALMFPGQGAQHVGMGKDLIQEFPYSREIFDLADDTLKIKLSNIMFEGY